MNKTERKMLDLLRKGRQESGYVGVKAEFEAEGTRVDELLRLLEIARRADLEVALKIGGCEAVRDLLEAKQFGAHYIIAPMIESPYALEKFINAKNHAYSEEDRTDTQFLFNLETVAGYREREMLVKAAANEDEIQGVVFGRSDFCGSLGLSRDAVNEDRITAQILDVADLCRQQERDLVVGGGVSSDSVPALRRIREVRLTRFETRKIVFDGAAVESPQINTGMLDAIGFELLWLENKREYYGMIHEEDARRIGMLKARERHVAGVSG